jgi:hypothetical protein
MAERTLQRTTRLVDWATILAVTLSMGWMFSAPLRAHDDLLAYAQDDFYYYLAVARNLADGLGSTFDGRTLTNGYHPLYLLLLWAVSLSARSLRAVFWWLAAIDTLSAAGIFLAARAFLARQFASVWLRNALALLFVSRLRIILCEQMEVNLALPLAICFLLLLDRPPETVSPRRWGAIGGVAALLVLARLDAALLVGLVGVLAISIPGCRKSITLGRVMAFCGGLLPPLAGYLLINKLVFHRLTPISGAAKQMETTHHFAWNALSLSVTPSIEGIFLLALLALAVVALRWKVLAAERRLVYTAALIFPFLHWALNLFLSDWPVWPWYAYSVRIALLVVFAVAANSCAKWFRERWWRMGEIALFALAALLLTVQHYSIGGYMIDTARAAEAIRSFAMTHPGRYAMGDRAGMVGYIDGQPTLQTEGLMMDDAYLAHIRRQDSLNDVLRLYAVDFYVSFEGKTGDGSHMDQSGCYHAKEPAQAGSQSPVMRGVFCQPSVLDFDAASGRTRVFDLRQR